MNELKIIELSSVLFNVLFLIFLTREQKICWIFGTIGSGIGAYIMIQSGYYSETLLYIFYAIMGIYGYVYWGKKESAPFEIKHMRILHLMGLIISGILLSLGLGYLMSKTDASRPYYDAISSIFGVIATFLELYKYVISWGFWIVLNAYTIWLYEVKELNFLALQMALYTLLSIYGLYRWKSKMADC